MQEDTFMSLYNRCEDSAKSYHAVVALVLDFLRNLEVFPHGLLSSSAHLAKFYHRGGSMVGCFARARRTEAVQTDLPGRGFKLVTSFGDGGLGLRLFKYRCGGLSS